MLRHIVTWRMNGETLEQRRAQAAEVVAALAPLADTVPSVRSFELHRDELQDGVNWDLTLVADFADLEGLKAYATHPDHLLAAEVIKANAAARAGIDYTV